MSFGEDFFEFIEIVLIFPYFLRLDTKQSLELYKDVITDFKYFKISEEFEEKIRSDGKSPLDDDLRENYLDILIRFYAAFQSVHKYVLDLNAFVDNLEDYNYGNLESILQDEEGRQLLVSR